MSEVLLRINNLAVVGRDGSGSYARTIATIAVIKPMIRPLSTIPTLSEGGVILKLYFWDLLLVVLSMRLCNP
jgi:hypothetical protein